MGKGHFLGATKNQVFVGKRRILFRVSSCHGLFRLVLFIFHVNFFLNFFFTGRWGFDPSQKYRNARESLMEIRLLWRSISNKRLKLG